MCFRTICFASKDVWQKPLVAVAVIAVQVVIDLRNAKRKYDNDNRNK